MEEEKQFTTIQIDKEVLAKLEKLKIHPRQSNNEVIRILLKLEKPKFVRADKLK